MDADTIGVVIVTITGFGLLISYFICIYSYDNKQAVFYHYLPPISGFFMSIIIGCLLLLDYPIQFIKLVIGLTLAGWWFWFLAWIEHWLGRRKKRRNRLFNRRFR